MEGDPVQLLYSLNSALGVTTSHGLGSFRRSVSIYHTGQIHTYQCRVCRVRNIKYPLLSPLFYLAILERNLPLPHEQIPGSQEISSINNAGSSCRMLAPRGLRLHRTRHLDICNQRMTDVFHVNPVLRTEEGLGGGVCVATLIKAVKVVQCGGRPHTGPDAAVGPLVHSQAQGLFLWLESELPKLAREPFKVFSSQSDSVDCV